MRTKQSSAPMPSQFIRGFCPAIPLLCPLNVDRHDVTTCPVSLEYAKQTPHSKLTYGPAWFKFFAFDTTDDAIQVRQIIIYRLIRHDYLVWEL
jgi:hypothetical protein